MTGHNMPIGFVPKFTDHKEQTQSHSPVSDRSYRYGNCVDLSSSFSLPYRWHKSQ